jgi:hypothetical protein
MLRLASASVYVCALFRCSPFRSSPRRVSAATPIAADQTRRCPRAHGSHASGVPAPHDADITFRSDAGESTANANTNRRMQPTTKKPRGESSERQPTSVRLPHCRRMACRNHSNEPPLWKQSCNSAVRATARRHAILGQCLLPPDRQRDGVRWCACVRACVCVIGYSWGVTGAPGRCILQAGVRRLCEKHSNE